MRIKEKQKQPPDFTTAATADSEVRIYTIYGLSKADLGQRSTQPSSVLIARFIGTFGPPQTAASGQNPRLPIPAQ